MQKASELASLGLDLWEAGDLSGAEAKTRQALDMLPPDHWAITMVRGQLAGVLASMGRYEEARRHYELTLQREVVDAGGDETHSSCCSKWAMR